MTYKDKDKQRDAIKKATQRYRANKGDSALSGSKEVSQDAPESSVVDEVSDTRPVIPSCDTLDVKIANGTVFNNGEPSPPSEPRGPEDYQPKRGKDIKCFADPKDLPPAVQASIILSKVGVLASVVIGKPGDTDYNGVCTEAWRAERGR